MRNNNIALDPKPLGLVLVGVGLGLGLFAYAHRPASSMADLVERGGILFLDPASCRVLAAGALTLTGWGLLRILQVPRVIKIGRGPATRQMGGGKFGLAPSGHWPREK